MAGVISLITGLAGELRGSLRLVLLAHDRDTLAPFTGSSRLEKDPSRFPHGLVSKMTQRTHPPSQIRGPTAPSSCLDLGSVLITRPALRAELLFGRPRPLPGRDEHAEDPLARATPRGRLPHCMHVIIMGCGSRRIRVGQRDRRRARRRDHRQEPRGVPRLSPRERAPDRGVADRDVLENAGIKDADAFVRSRAATTRTSSRPAWRSSTTTCPRSSPDLYDSRRAEMHERLNIPTVATTRWGVKQMQLMLFHDREEIARRSAGATSCGSGSRSPTIWPASRCRRWRSTARYAWRGLAEAVVHPHGVLHAPSGRLPDPHDLQGRPGAGRRTDGARGPSA